MAASISQRRWRNSSRTRALTISGRWPTSRSRTAVPNERCARSSRARDRCSRRAICRICCVRKQLRWLFTYSIVNWQRDDGKTPFEACFGFKPNVAHLGPFGCDAYLMIPDGNRKKLNAKSHRVTFDGYNETEKISVSLIGRSAKCLFRVTSNLTRPRRCRSKTNFTASKRWAAAEDECHVEFVLSSRRDPKGDRWEWFETRWRSRCIVARFSW